MQLKRRIMVAMAVMFAAPLLVVTFLIAYIRAHPGPVAEHAMPFKYALIGFTIDIAVIVAFWRALKRLDKIRQSITTPSTRAQ